MANPSASGLAALGLVLAVFGLQPAAGQPLTCGRCSDLHEEAAVRLQMIQDREALLRDVRGSPEIGQRIDMEIAALQAMGGGLTAADVDACYRSCRFGLDRTLTQMRNEAVIEVSTNCTPCIAVAETVNDELDTLHSLAQQGESEGTLRMVLETRNRAAEALIDCEQQACRAEDVRKNGEPLTAAYYQRALRHAPDPRTWAAEPVDVTALPDYAVPIQPFGEGLTDE